MAFNSLQYIIFLLVVVTGYYLVPTRFVKLRNCFLLVASYYFYMQWNKVYIFLIVAVTLLTYLFGILVEKTSKLRKKLTGLCIVVAIVLLAYFKYMAMIFSYINVIITHVGFSEISIFNDIILPVGISFFTLQSIGYVIDVYRGNVRAEHNFVIYALFVSFFPQLVAGPIERAERLIAQIKEEHRFNYDKFRRGIYLLMYGLFLKMVIADGAAIIVDKIYADYDTFSGMYIAVGTVFFLIQLYCDFYGYSTIARGSAQLLGIELMNNFDAPFWSLDVKEFWRRWHISLSGWFRDYLYFPLGGNRKGIFRGYINIMIVFLVSGLWHGASIAFVVWGGINGIYQIISDIWRRICSKRLFDISMVANRMIKRLSTFMMIAFSMIFFRAGQFRTAENMIKSMFSELNFTIFFDNSLYELGVPQNQFVVLILAIIVLLFLDYLKYKQIDVVGVILKQPYWFRLVCLVGLFVSIIIYGSYGVGFNAHQFVYFQF